MRTWIKDPFDRLRMYARRQRRVQSGSTNVQTLMLTTLNPDEILSVNQILYLILSYRTGYYPTRLPRWRSGHAVDCRSTTLRFKSGPWLWVMAAIAVGKHLDSFRTQQLSRLTWSVVLRYASPREPYNAASIVLIHRCFHCVFFACLF